LKNISVSNIGLTEIGLNRIADQIHSSALSIVRQGAKEIAELASKMAPVDEGDLEGAIKILGENSAGRNNRNVIFVGVDPEELGLGFTKYGYRYDIWTHEAVYNLGEKSVLKQLGQLPRVGPKYLERAVTELLPDLQLKLERSADKIRRL